MKYLLIAFTLSAHLFAMRHHSEVISLLESSAYASTKAEFVELNISIHAECYKDINEMLEASNKEANRITEIINNMSNPALGDNTCIKPGMISSFQRSTGWGENEHKTCEGSWQVTHSITATYHDVDSFSDFYNKLIQQMSLQGSKELEESFLQSSLNGYHEGVSKETNEKLKNKAFVSAYEKACHQFSMICPNKSYKTSISNLPPFQGSSRNYSMMESAYAKVADSPTGIEAAIDDYSVSSTIYVTFMHPAIACSHSSSDEDEENFSLGSIEGR